MQLIYLNVFYVQILKNDLKSLILDATDGIIKWLPKILLESIKVSQ